MRYLYRVIFFRLMGWKLQGTIDPSIKKCVVIVAPHTSWFDFLIGLMVRRILRLEINFLAKKELFKPPFGWYFRWVGGTPLDRTPNQNKVDAIAEIFRRKDVLRLAMSPEGTRKKTERWKTGFYYIAKAAKVPVIRVAFDYGKKQVTFSEPFYPTENVEKDLREILEFYDGVQGKVVDNF